MRGPPLARSILAHSDEAGAARARTGPGPVHGFAGIDARDLDEVLDAGAERIVVVRALTEADDPAAAAAGLARRLRERSGVHLVDT